MNIKNFLQNLTEPVGKRTLCFLIDENKKEVLLGMKKKGFAKGGTEQKCSNPHNDKSFDTFIYYLISIRLWKRKYLISQY